MVFILISGEFFFISDGRVYSLLVCFFMYSVGLKCNKIVNIESSFDGGRNYYYLVVKC